MIGCEQCKSVFTDDDAFSGTGIAMNGTNDSFLVALSAIASNTSVTGMSNAPTDTMLLPLDRYTPGTNEEYPYLQTTLESDGQLESVTVINGVKNSADKAVTGNL